MEYSLKSEINNLINGEIINNTHYYITRIFYEDTDAGGIVYHANYLKYFERARTSLLNLINIDQKQLLEKKKLGFVVRDINLRINKSFQFNQILLVKTCLKSAKKSCIVLKHEAYEIIQGILDKKEWTFWNEKGNIIEPNKELIDKIELCASQLK